MGFQINRFELLVEPKDFYRNGDRVNCLLIIDLFGTLKCKHVFITAIGEMSTDNRKYEPYLYKENYTQINHFMAIPFNLTDLGVHRIPFYFYLDNASLPTHKSVNGHIVYFVEAVIDKKLFSDLSFSSRVDIKIKIDNKMRYLDEYNSPVATNREKLIRVFGLKVGSVRLSAHLDKSVFYAGETFDIHFHMDNRSTHPAQMMAQLVQKTAFKRDLYYLDSESVLAGNYPDLCGVRRSQSDIVRLSIPYSTVTSFESQVLDIEYAIRLYVSVSDDPHHFDDIPIFIK